MKLILMLLSVFQVSAQTTIEGLIADDNASLVASQNRSDMVAQNRPDVAKIKACLDKVAEKAKITSRDYATTGKDHFLFNSSNPRSFIYLGEKGLFDCRLNWPNGKQYSFSLDGQSMKPYGDYPSAGSLTGKDCTRVEDTGKMINQAQANLKYLGEVSAANCKEVKAFVKSACSAIPDQQTYVQKGCNVGEVPEGTTVTPVSGGTAQ
jgi:hypothetical protein